MYNDNKELTLNKMMNRVTKNKYIWSDICLTLYYTSEVHNETRGIFALL